MPSFTFLEISTTISTLRIYFSYFIIFALLLLPGCNSGSSSADSNNGSGSLISNNPSSDKAITQFFLNGYAGVITESEISVIIPYSLDESNLVATYTTTGVSVTVNGIPQESGVTPNNFESPVLYTVTAEDNSVATYTVTVSRESPSSAAEITDFSFNINGYVYESVPDSSNKIVINVPYGTNVQNLAANFQYVGKTVSVNGIQQTSGVTANNFSSPVIYTVTAQDDTTKNYTVIVNVALNSADDITSFSLTDSSGANFPGVI